MRHMVEQVEGMREFKCFFQQPGLWVRAVLESTDWKALKWIIWVVKEDSEIQCLIMLMECG